MASSPTASTSPQPPSSLVGRLKLFSNSRVMFEISKLFT